MGQNKAPFRPILTQPLAEPKTLEIVNWEVQKKFENAKDFA